MLAPLPRPGKNVFCVGRNYRLHIIEGNLAAKRDPNDFPKAAEFFSKPWERGVAEELERVVAEGLAKAAAAPDSTAADETTD